MLFSENPHNLFESAVRAVSLGNYNLATNASESMREEIAKELGQYPGNQIAKQTLETVLAHDPSSQVVGIAATSLFSSGAVAASKIQEGLQRLPMSKSGIEALKQIGEAAIPMMCDILTHSADPYCRIDVAEELGKYKDSPDAVDALRTAAREDPDKWVSLRAAISLLSICGDDAAADIQVGIGQKRFGVEHEELFTSLLQYAYDHSLTATMFGLAAIWVSSPEIARLQADVLEALQTNASVDLTELQSVLHKRVLSLYSDRWETQYCAQGALVQLLRLKDPIAFALAPLHLLDMQRGYYYGDGREYPDPFSIQWEINRLQSSPSVADGLVAIASQTDEETGPALNRMAAWALGNMSKSVLGGMKQQVALDGVLTPDPKTRILLSRIFSTLGEKGLEVLKDAELHEVDENVRREMRRHIWALEGGFINRIKLITSGIFRRRRNFIDLNQCIVDLSRCVSQGRWPTGLDSTPTPGTTPTQLRAGTNAGSRQNVPVPSELTA